MINRQNWLDVKGFLDYQKRIQQNEPATIARYRKHLRHLLEWADDKPLPRARSFDPTLPAYLMAAERENSEEPFSPATLTKALQVSRQFFDFARKEWSTRYKGITESWIATLQPPKRASLQSQLKEHEHYRLEDVLKIAALPVHTVREMRDRAAVCFLFLSGMRVDAFASMPISCVNVEEGKVYQLPERGVRTKNSKAAITFLLPIPELQAVVKEWDAFVRKSLKPSALWFSVLSRDGDHLIDQSRAHLNRRGSVADGIGALCERVNIPYMSPHKIRHGHIVYALRNVQDMAGLKAISQNVMHSSVTITDSIYGNLAGEDVHRVINGIHHGPQPSQAQSKSSDIEAAAKLLELLRDHPNLINSLTGEK